MKPDEKIRIALVGCGSISKKHVAAIGRVEGAEIVGAFDSNGDAAEAFRDEHGIPVFVSPDELVEKAQPHVFDVLTPSGLHARTIEEFLPYGRHFIVEKPLALRLDQIDRILAECDRRGLKIFVVQQNRYNPPVAKLKEAVDNGRLGKMVMGTVRVRWAREQSYYDARPWRGTWALDGGVLTNQASHFIDMLIWLMGEPESVTAMTSTRLCDIEAEDTGAAIIRFRSGALGVIEATICTRPRDIEGSISVLGERGAVEIGGFYMNALKHWKFTEEDEWDEDVRKNHALTPEEFAWNHTEFFRSALASLRQGTRGMIDGLEGRKSVELITAIYESAETGREIPLRFSPKKCRLGENT